MYAASYVVLVFLALVSLLVLIKDYDSLRLEDDTLTVVYFFKRNETYKFSEMKDMLFNEGKIDYGWLGGANANLQVKKLRLTIVERDGNKKILNFSDSRGAVFAKKIVERFKKMKHK